MPPPLTISFPASVMRRRGAATMVASTICPPIARYPGEISGVLKMRVEPGEEFLHRAGPRQGFPEPPDGRLVRRPRAIIEAEETAKGAPVHDWELRPRIRQTVERLDHQHLEHEDRVHRRAPSLPAIETIKRRIQLRPEELEVDNPCKPLRRISAFDNAA